MYPHVLLLSHCCEQIPDKRQLREEGLIPVHILRTENIIVSTMEAWWQTRLLAHVSVDQEVRQDGRLDRTMNLKV